MTKKALVDLKGKIIREIDDWCWDYINEINRGGKATRGKGNPVRNLSSCVVCVSRMATASRVINMGGSTVARVRRARGWQAWYNIPAGRAPLFHLASRSERVCQSWLRNKRSSTTLRRPNWANGRASRSSSGTPRPTSSWVAPAPAGVSQPHPCSHRPALPLLNKQYSSFIFVLYDRK